MANTTPLLLLQGSYKPTNTTNYSKDSSIASTGPNNNTIDGAVHDEIPTIDYFMLFSNDQNQRSLALKTFSHACQDYGFFYLVNHGVPDSVLEGVFRGMSEFFDPEQVEYRRQFDKKHPTDRIRWGLRSYPGENREYLKVVTHPQFHCPPKPAGFSKAMEEYYKRLREVVHGLAKALSKSLGLEECYLHNAFNLKSGFEVSAMNHYPPNFQSNGSMGISDHTDPGLFVSLIQQVDGGLQILSHQGKWINVYIPRNAILMQIGDQLEILSNGKYKSHVHRVVVEKNEVRRLTVATLHGPSLDTFVSPAMEFVDDSHPPLYHGTTYKQSLEANGDEVDVQSNLEQLRLY